MATMVVPTYWTGDMVRALPEDGKRHELVKGELLVSPAPGGPHQLIAKRILVRLDQYLETEAIGTVLMAPADLSWGTDNVLMQPDVFVYSGLDEVTDWARLREFPLIVEVLSPSTARVDRFIKRPEYQRRGVSLLWLVDPIERHVEIWKPDMDFPTIERNELTWHPAGAAKPFRLPLIKVFPKIG